MINPAKTPATIIARAALFAGSLVAATSLGTVAHAQLNEIRMMEAGGASGESIEEGYLKPFTEKTGIKVVRESPWSLGKLRGMVETGVITNAIVELDSLAVEQAKALNLLEPLDWQAIDPMPIFDEARQEKAIGYQYYSTLMAWRADAKPVSSWAEFWDVENFPGKRALPNYPTYTLPIALLADGVKPEDLYPLDLDRAFESLEKIKGHVSVWWDAGAQPPQLLKDNEVQYAVAWSGRVAGQEGIGYTFKNALLDLAFFTVPRGASAEQKAAAFKIMHEMTVPENQAAAAKVISYTGNSPDLEPLLPQDRLDEFPTTQANKQVQILPEPKWWFENADLVEERWQEFKLGL
ncbi:extracellular solute-binding protein (plasmid) [Skermanella rosea]|uniref:extracellular solute-binding protein n=1 Tax=Skermanella rosea TaxID=1817965 RepID=UPI001933F04E|nr:extracellular solute-binding protein [Skermanella rosea]UEM07780.1 extracellular solute-binding protein [Skermanella rosea]